MRLSLKALTAPARRAMDGIQMSMKRGKWGMITDENGRPVKGPMVVGVSGPIYTHSNSVSNVAKKIYDGTLGELGPESGFHTDPYWFEKKFIDGKYGDLWVQEGHSREDLEGFSQWLRQFNSDFIDPSYPSDPPLN